MDQPKPKSQREERALLDLAYSISKDPRLPQDLQTNAQVICHGVKSLINRGHALRRRIAQAKKAQPHKPAN